MKIIAYLAGFALLLSSCGTQKVVVPQWVDAKPIDASGTYIYGTGMTFVNRNLAYQEVARQNALSDLASELQGELYDKSVFVQQENRGGFNTYFTSETEVVTRLKMEDYELVESYSDGVRYYVLYRLDVKHFKFKKAERDAALRAQIDTQLNNATSLDNGLSLEERYKLLADALHAAEQGGLLWGAQATTLSGAIRTAMNALESAITATFSFADRTYYLGVANSFEGRISLDSRFGRANTLPLSITASDGYFEALPTGKLICSKTGRSRDKHLTARVDFERLLANYSVKIRSWFAAQSQFETHADLVFHAPSLVLRVDPLLYEELSTLLGRQFSIAQEGPLVLEQQGNFVNVERAGSTLFRRDFEGSFVLVNQSEQRVLMQKSMDQQGIARTAKDANAQLVKGIVEEFSFIVLPSIERSLNF